MTIVIHDVQFYYEPGTNAKFRTYQSVLRHLETKKAVQKAMEKAEQRKLANGMKFKSVIAAKTAARQIVAIKKED